MIEVGLRMTNFCVLFLREQPQHIVILRPTFVIQTSHKFGRRTLYWLIRQINMIP